MNARLRAGSQGAQGATAAALGDAAPVGGLTLWDLRALVREELAAALGDAASTRVPPLLTTDDLAEHLGVSDRTIRSLRAEGLPTILVGESPRFELGAVHAWLQSRGK